MSRRLIGLAFASILGVSALGTGTAMAGTTTARYVAGPFSSLNSCNAARLNYVHDGEFEYISSCMRSSQNYLQWYFAYQDLD